MERIRQLRMELGLSQAKLAVRADMDPATLNRLEQGKGNPNLRTLERVADALGVEVGEFFPPEQPDLFTAAKPGASYAGQAPPDLRLAEMYEATRRDRERALRAAGAAEVRRYLAEVERALEAAGRGPAAGDTPDTPDTRRQLVAYVSRLGALRDQALPHAGVDETQDYPPPVALGA